MQKSTKETLIFNKLNDWPIDLNDSVNIIRVLSFIQIYSILSTAGKNKNIPEFRGCNSNGKSKNGISIQ